MDKVIVKSVCMYKLIWMFVKRDIECEWHYQKYELEQGCVFGNEVGFRK
mgnify:FL=1